MGIFSRSSSPATEPAGTPLSRLMDEGRDDFDAGQLVRALARSVVHIPMPGTPAVPQPRVVSGGPGEEPPLYVVEDGDGTHAFLYSTPRRLVEAFGEVTAASVPFATLLMGWPEGVDVVIDPGHRDALEVPLAVLEHVALEVAGVPTGTSVAPSPDDRREIPDPELTQLIGATRQLAAGLPEVAALYRAMAVPAGPSPRPVIELLVELDDVSDERLHEIMTALSATVQEAEPRPMRLLASRAGQPADPELANAVRSVDEPYYVRDAG